MLSHRHWTNFILLLFFTITLCQGYNYGNDTGVGIFDARDLEVRAGPRSGTGSPVLRKLRIVAVGDIHGDFDRFVTILKYLNVVNEHGEWSGKVDVFVQLGDVIDRGPDTKELFKYLDKLREDAPSTGGRVYTLLGNHEVKNLMYEWNWMNPEELKTFGSTDVRKQALTRDGLIGKSLADNYLGALLLPLYPPDNTPGKGSQLSHPAIAFMHAGLDPSTYEKLLPFPTEINRIAKGLVQHLQDFLSKNVRNLPFNRRELTPEQKLLCDKKEGALWYRGLAGKNPDCAKVEKMLKDIGARRIVVGHTRNEKGIVEKCNGRIVVIDTGITRWEQRVGLGYLLPTKYRWIKGEGGMLSALDIRYIFDGKTQREVIHAVYPGLKKPLDFVQLADIPF